MRYEWGIEKIYEKPHPERCSRKTLKKCIKRYALISPIGLTPFIEKSIKSF